MPHNRAKREADIKNQYEFVFFGHEYHWGHAVLAAVDGYVTGGTVTAEYLKNEVAEFGIDLVAKMAECGLNPLTEPLYFDKMIFETWEQPTPWWRQSTGNRFVPYVAARKKGAAQSGRLIMDQCAGVVNNGNGEFYLCRVNGDLAYYKHVAWETGDSVWEYEHGNTVGRGWGQFIRIMPGRNGLLYGVNHDGTLLVYNHIGHTTGSPTWQHNDGVAVGTGFNGFLSLTHGGKGVIYGIKATDPVGDLMWYRHTGGANLTPTWENGGIGRRIGWGFQDFLSVFAGDKGTIYAVAQDGTLRFYKYPGWKVGDGDFSIQNKDIGATGFDGFVQVMYGGSGVIYGIKTNGDLMWYRHLGHETGDVDWAEGGVGKLVGSDFRVA